MGQITYGFAAFVCLFASASTQRVESPLFPPHPTHACYGAQLYEDMKVDLGYICNNGAAYPAREINEALAFADDYWRIYLNLTSTCFQEKNNFFMNDLTKKDFYHLKSVCDTRRTLVKSVFSKEKLVCHVVNPEQQKVYYAQCGGTCKLGYDGVTGYHCIPKGMTSRKFMAYCVLPRNYDIKKDLSCFDPSFEHPYDPRYPKPLRNQGLPMDPMMNMPMDPSMNHPMDPSMNHPMDPSMNHPMDPMMNGPMDPMMNGPMDPMMNIPMHPSNRIPINPQPSGFFTEVSVDLPTYCGCRGYFCS